MKNIYWLRVSLICAALSSARRQKSRQSPEHRFSATSPFWIGENHSEASRRYDGTGTPGSLVANVPSPTGPSTVIFNTSQSFAVATGKPASFIFCTEDGTIAGWNSSVNATNAQIMVDNSASKAVYKGSLSAAL
ncbi:MAG TPA: hypothetical protein VKV15_16840 [Bryobacteraceae bacterium]|nr:hypothetical protein [Bryobacteraceae bacterium]